MICLLPHCGYLSETTRMLEIREALLARGAEVCVATHGGVHQALLDQLEVPYTVVGPPIGIERSRELVRNGAGMGPPNQSMWTDEEIRTYALAEADLFRERGVRVAVTGFTLTALLSTRLAGIPLACEHAGAMVPPLWERNMIDAYLTSPIPGTNILPKVLRRKLANLGVHRAKLHCAGFNRVADDLGVEGVPSFAQLLLGDVTIVTEVPEVLGISAEDLEAWRPRGPGYRSTTRLHAGGPIFAHLDVPLPERVQAFLDQDGPVVYVAITSSPEDQVRAVVESVRAAGARTLVAGTVHDLADLDRDGVLVGGILPSHLVMPQVDLAVIAGAQGSVQCALASGTPLIALPLQPEQDLNGQLVERRGAGRRMTFADAATPKLTAAVREMLADPSYRSAARGVQAEYAAVDGPGLAAGVILAAA